MPTTIHPETQRRLRGHKFYPPQAVLKKIPKLYSTAVGADPMDLVVHVHYFGGPADWYVLEYDPKTTRAFGWADLGVGGAEFGYFMLNEIEQVRVAGMFPIERELDWVPIPLREALRRRG